ncbi:MAG: AAA family ATPase [bacterium]
MKIAVSGKGGVGKTTLCAALSLLMARKGVEVLAVDADPDANLACALGIPSDEQKKIIPISEQKALIEERTGAKVKQYGQIFQLNPEVSDISEKYAYKYNGVGLLVLGGIEQGGSGCACPENVLIKALISDIILNKNQTIVMDMEAGIEHLGRATTRGVDVMLIVAEPGQHSVDSTKRIIALSKEIGLKKILVAANKIESEDDEKFIRDSFPGINLIGFIPYTGEIRSSDRNDQSVLDNLNKDNINIFNGILEEIEALA